MATHPLWRPYELVDIEELARVRLAGPGRPVEVVPYDGRWPSEFALLSSIVRGALGDRVVQLEHVGSTAVPGLAAKPVIDADLTVADSGDEAAYVPELEAAGFVLRVREPEWEEHRVLAIEEPKTNLHVWSPGSVEASRHAAFRDWLRSHPDDRDAYGALKAELAAAGFADVMDYNNHKAALVYDIYEKVFAADPAYEHDPQPRPDEPAAGL
ncbi:MAG TPA: GrpB family protein [Nocardioides sp.]|uniref:GrpB family protein n=1 Tax=Nocardioides sp. TaxID=35761 RepID=UPI002E354C1C|nr:GrpB family protein [Nocardioides sp.]HEX5088602.1 GrpB family protein [Nocardioides sp.]